MSGQAHAEPRGVTRREHRVAHAPRALLEPQRMAEHELPIALAALLAAGAAVWLTARADFLEHPGWLAALKADIILGPVLVGLYWLRRRPLSRFGPLLVVAGLFGGAPYALQSASEPTLFGIGLLWEGIWYLTTLVLIVSFPTGRLEGRAERAIVAVGAVTVTGAVAAATLLAPRLTPNSTIAACRAECPENGLHLVSEDALAVEVLRVGRVGLIVVALVVVALLVRRLVTGTPPRRRALAIGAPVGIVFLLLQATWQATKLFEVEGDAFAQVVEWMLVGARVSVWYGFLLALIAAELYAGRVLRRVVIESLRRPGLGELEALLREPLGDPGLRLAFRRRSSDAWVDARGAALAPPDRGSGRVLTEVERGEREGAAIVHDAQLAEEPELLRAAGAIALLARENTQLEDGWNASLRELRESRRRIVAASEGERRKLERDLHDGAQQRLITLRIHLALASEQAEADPAMSARLVELEGEADEAIEELRDLAHGIFPSLLAERGLVPALRAVALRAPRAIEVRGRGIGRHPPEVESAVYFCCLEALQNAIKHAGPAAHITAHLTVRDGELRLEVRDDGPGFDVARARDGDGLRNMEDRLGAVHGHLSIQSSPGDGTLISGVVPIGAA